MNNIAKFFLILIVVIIFSACDDNALEDSLSFELPDSLNFMARDFLTVDFDQYINYYDKSKLEITVTGNNYINVEINSLSVTMTTLVPWAGQECLHFTVTNDEGTKSATETVYVIVKLATADIQIANLSDNPANVYIHNSGSSSYIQDTIPANASIIVTIEDGDAGINVNGGMATVDYRHILQNEEVDVFSSIYADLSITTLTSIQIDNVYGCLDIESYSQTADMWVSIDFGLPEIIPAWEDLTKFYDPSGLEIVKHIEYNGYTLFSGFTNISVFEDTYTRFDIYPDAGCIWIKNTSHSYIIEEVYISPSYETTWGENDLEYYIYPDEFYTWTCTSGMEWDFKVVDDWGDSFTFFNINMGTDDVYTYDYDGFRSAKNPDADQDKITNAKNAEVPLADARCEANDIPVKAISISSEK